MSEVSSPRQPMHGRPDFWSPTTIDKLAILWQSGASTVDIGKRLGTSKNAVVGKAHRQFDLGDIRFTPRPSPIKPSSGNYDLISHHLKKGTPTLPALFSATQVAVAQQPTIGARLATRPAIRLFNAIPECQFPIGEPGTKGFRMCYDPTDPGKPYCPTHCALTYTKPQLNESQQKTLANRAAANESRQRMYANGD